MKALLLFFISLNAMANRPTSIKTIPVKINTDKIQNTTDEKYLSFGLDTAQIVGSFWWDKEGDMTGGRGKNKTSPMNLKDSLLRKHVKELSPAYLRIGGSEADALYYNMKDNTENRPKQYDSTLTKKKWREIESFVKDTNTELFFTLNQGPSSWDKKGKWKTDNLEEFLKFLSTDSRIPFKFELGNEVFAYWAIFGLRYHLSEKDYANNFLKAKKLFKKYNIKTKLAGPASAFWPIIGEPLGFLFNEMEDLFPILKNKYDIITWHYYPTQSFRCPLAIRRMNKERLMDVKVLDEVKKWADHLVEEKNQYSPNAELWLGETGSAQCGGEPEISTNFISSFWWLDQLGILAIRDHKVIIRHNLIGADYALLNDDATARPDYYSSWLWNKYMGTQVLSATSSHKKIRTYAHCSPDNNSVSLLIINLDKTEHYLSLDKITSANIIRVSTTNAFSQNYLVNNGKIQSLSDLQQIKPEQIEPKQFLITKESISFLKLQGINSVCKKK